VTISNQNHNLLYEETIHVCTLPVCGMLTDVFCCLSADIVAEVPVSHEK